MIEDLLQPRHLLLILVLLMVLIPFANIFRKAGYSAWLCLLVAIPGVGVIVLYWLAFSKWPLEAELARMRKSSSAGAVM